MSTCATCNGSMEPGVAFKNCGDCRRASVAKEAATKERREEAAKKEVAESSGSKKMCTRCKYARDVNVFRTGDREFNSCRSCRENGQRSDVKRKTSVHRKEQIKNGPGHWKTYRAKKRMDNRDAFLRHNAEVMKAWRIKNPEKWAANQAKAKRSDNIRATKQQAEVKGIPWEISMEYGLDMSSKPCFYCLEFSPSGINGIDRLDSLKGYSNVNVRPCCKRCNMSKGTLDPVSFVNACESIHLYISGAKEESESGNGLMGHHGSSYANYKTRAARIGVKFDIGEEEFKLIKSRACYLCGRRGANGIDRKDNSDGYTLENSFPCCGECNYLKRDHTYDDFLEMVAKITGNASMVRDLLPEDIPKNLSSRTFMRSEKLKGEALKEHLKKKKEERLSVTQEKYVKMAQNA